VMVNLPYKLGRKAVTTRMEVIFRRPAPVGQELLFTAQIVKETHRTLEALAQAQMADGTVVAEARGTLMKL
jgi:acyl-coenzyme A thioesterase PaaI-like protein